MVKPILNNLVLLVGWFCLLVKVETFHLLVGQGKQSSASSAIGIMIYGMLSMTISTGMAVKKFTIYPSNGTTQGPQVHCHVIYLMLTIRLLFL
jgi:hypothetical protein